ncbi:TetR/AcrR family transcriptional regulator [Dactylosporangium sp. NPDC049525]|uniref:TetR/AcrR family transcriptional regulator n=1 Tax=Dactylosporangium sp. NPDC049525 TaxID=3154730 RepID=UPI0034458478
MPRLWSATIDEHRRTVHTAILDATAALVAAHGLAGVSMSQIAAEVGIGRATLYKYFPDVEAIVVAWHERQVGDHLTQLRAAAEQPGPPGARLRLVLETFARLFTTGRQQHGPGLGHSPDLAVPLHRAEHMHAARHQLHALLADVIAAAADAGEVRADVPATELAVFCQHALTAAADLPSPAAHERLLELTLAALRPAPAG